MMNTEFSKEETREVSIAKFNYLLLEEKAEQLGVPMSEIVEWLITECMDEFEKYMA